MNEPSYFGLTNDCTWLSVDEEYYKKLKPTHRMKCYTHPVELTDEEIDKAIEYAIMQGYGSSYVEGLSDGFEMAKAILRKAQEK